MRCYWLKFEDGSEGHCEGQSAYDAQIIAEKLTDKKVAGSDEFKWHAEDNPNIKGLPYPARGRIWKFEHPIYGAAPSFCLGTPECRGKSSCPRNYACSE